jgi:asparagine synthase (glutamine-hydrolysing)
MSVHGGIWNYDGRPVDTAALTKISHTTAEYAPDGEVIRILGDVGLLYRPFHTTADSHLDPQPYSFGNGKTLLWDGRLDNRDDLIPELGDLLRAPTSDVGIVAAAYQRWGGEAFAKLIGDWALALWDASDRRLILARDYIGIKPLFYYASPGRFLWCSHLAPLAQSGDQFTLCGEYVAGYLTHWPDSNLTPYREIRSVAPGTWVSVTPNRISSRSYWEFQPRRKTRYRTDAEYEEQFSYLFRQSVRRRMRSDGPVLADLSGGMDSSSIVCMADDISTHEALPQVDTFSFYDRNEPEEDDFVYFVKVEDKRGQVGHHVDLAGDGDTFALDYPRFVPVPGLDVRQELKEAYSAITAQGSYRVVLSGVGGDEMLGQALDPRIQMADVIQQGRLVELVKLLTAWSPLLRYPLLQLLGQSFALALPKWIRPLVTLSARPEAWMDAGFARAHRVADRQMKAAEGKLYWLPSTRDYLQTVNALSRQVTHTFPTTHEIRYPYLDQALVEFLTSIPTNQLLRPGHRRSLMRRTLAELLPPEILARRTKAGPARCYVSTLQKHWNAVESVLATPTGCQPGYLNQAEFADALTGAKNGNLPRKFLRLLKALSIELWIKDVRARGIIRGDFHSRPNSGTTVGCAIPIGKGA